MNDQALSLIIKDGNINGIIKCTIDEWIGVCYKIPRNKLKEASKLEYINNTGIYILFGDDENTGKKIAYIGESRHLYKRILEHNRNKDFWNECLIFTTINDSLNTGHIVSIEEKLIKEGKIVSRYIIKNDKKGSSSIITDGDDIIATKFIERIKTLTSIFGYKVFESLLKHEELNNNNNLLYLNNNGINYAKGLITDEGFVILKGSKIKPEISEYISKSLINYCNRERSSDDIENGIFINNHLCSSPSMAAVIILGRNSNGYNEWKNKDGKTLREIIERE